MTAAHQHTLALAAGGDDEALATLPVPAARSCHALTHTTISPNVADGGQKTNVIPDVVDIDVDIRTVPGTTQADVMAMLREVLGELAGEAARHLAAKNQAWLEGNQAFMGRIANYKALLQAEKGGVLPLFKETRREVYEYWEKNKVDVARDWMTRFRESLESRWLGQLPTPGQQEDGKDFYKDAFERMEKHLKAVEAVAREFEEKWTGVFKGPLAPKTIDELVDSPVWNVNAQELIAIRTPEVVSEILENMDGYYEESFEQPLKSLESKIGDLPETARDEARRAIASARARVEEALRTRIKDLQRQVGESLRWFEPAEIQRALDRSELADDRES